MESYLSYYQQILNETLKLLQDQKVLSENYFDPLGFSILKKQVSQALTFDYKKEPDNFSSLAVTKLKLIFFFLDEIKDDILKSLNDISLMTDIPVMNDNLYLVKNKIMRTHDLVSVYFTDLENIIERENYNENKMKLVDNMLFGASVIFVVSLVKVIFYPK